MDADRVQEVINTAVGCVVASSMSLEKKEETIQGLREIEEALTDTDLDSSDDYQEDEDCEDGEEE